MHWMLHGVNLSRRASHAVLTSWFNQLVARVFANEWHVLDLELDCMRNTK
jgi:hypothetical protein